MSVTVGVNNLSVVHKDSGGVSIAFPDVCKVPAPPAPPIPVPFPNISKAADSDKCTKKVKADGNPVCVKDSTFKTSVGNEAGTLKGIASSKVQGVSEFINFSFDVKFEGKNVPRAFDPMLHNDKNTPPIPVLQPPIVAIPPSTKIGEIKSYCAICGKEME